MNNELLEKITNNRILLFIIPNLIYVTNLLNYYNTNFLKTGEVFFYEVVILATIFFLITLILNYLLLKFIKNPQKIYFVLLLLICSFYFTNISITTIIKFILLLSILNICFKKIDLKNIVIISIFSISFVFIYNSTIASYNLISSILKSKEYDYDISIKVEKETDTPNIYWIHCDGMTGIDAMKEYFNYDNKTLIEYFQKNNFVINKNANLVVSHQTQKALVSLFNPYYYDNFFKDYLNEIEQVFLEKKKTPKFIVKYNDVEEKRLNNELFYALKKKDYKTISIADFNEHTSLYTDYFYDFYYFEVEKNTDLKKSDLRLIKDKNKLKLQSYIRFSNFKTLLKASIFSGAKNINYLDYEKIDYNNFDSSNYKYIDEAMNNSNYWTTKAMLKALDESMKIEQNKFVFVDFKMIHEPFTFDEKGNVNTGKSVFYIQSYLGNYIYSINLLTDLLDYIKNNDEDAAVIVQADHGLHTIKNNDMKKYLNINVEEIQEIRNSVMSAYYIPDKYKNGDEKYLENPLNISRYIINNYIGENYEYIKSKN